MRVFPFVFAALAIAHHPALLPAATAESSTTPSSEPYVWKNVTIKANGFIDGIVFSPKERGLVYIHTDMGGAYRYDTSHERWTPLNDFSRFDDPATKSMGVETLAVDPTDASRVYMGVGTYMQSSAILRSSDRGQTWQRTDVPFEMNGNGSARNTGERMRVDPNSPNILFYGSRDDGLWQSTDQAATWSRVDSFPTIGLDRGWGKDTGLLFVEFDRASGKAAAPTPVVYVGVFDPTANVPRIFRTLDAGKSWSALPGGQPMAANLFPQRAALAPDGKTLYLTYATSTVYPGPYGVREGQVWKVAELASEHPTWTNITPQAANWTYSAIALAPTDAKTLYIGELGNYSPADRIWRSKDAGATWTVVEPNSHRDDSSAPYAASMKIHWLGDLAIDPFDHEVAIFTTGYGLYRTTNLNAATPTWTFFNEGFEQSAVLELESPNEGPVHLFSAIGDRDGFRHEDFDRSPAIGLLGQNTGMQRGTSDDIDVAWNDPNLLVRCVRQPPFVQWSSDNGITWKWVNASGAVGGNGGSLALSGDGTRIVYSPAGDATNRVIYSVRTGDRWSEWKAPAASQPAHGAKVVVDLANGMTFYALADRALSHSADGGEHWTVMSSDVVPSDANWMRAVPGHAGHLVVSAGKNGAWRSTNGGATWARMSEAVKEAIAIGVGAAGSGKTYPSLFVAGAVDGKAGFFRSDDEGKTWVSISDANHQFGYVTVIQGDPRVFGRLYVGSNGRGVLVGEPRK